MVRLCWVPTAVESWLICCEVRSKAFSFIYNNITSYDLYLHLGFFPLLGPPRISYKRFTQKYLLIVRMCNVGWFHGRYVFLRCHDFCFTLSSADEPGKQVKSAVGIKNTCKSLVAFKVLIVIVFQRITGFLFCNFGPLWSVLSLTTATGHN